MKAALIAHATPFDAPAKVTLCLQEIGDIRVTREGFGMGDTPVPDYLIHECIDAAVETFRTEIIRAFTRNQT